MTERLLQFIWQFQYFNKTSLTTTTGEAVQVIFAGQHNTNQGPDFSDAKIRIDNTVWAGTVELHIHASDWEKHHHQHDRNYKNVILHVVWQDDGYTGTAPVLELKSRVPAILLQHYEELMNSSAFIPCGNSIYTVSEITWKSWQERLLAERLLRKAKTVENYLGENNFHWEETFWWMLARSFGMKVNAEAFESIARSIPVNILARHKNQIHQLEALLFGQAGLLDKDFKEEYPGLLKREHQFQQSKYALQPARIPLLFLRMRPGNFPSVRLAQLAVLVHNSVHLFSKIKEAGSVKDVKKWLSVTPGDYWNYHYRLDEIAAFKKKPVGRDMIDNIVINTMVPVLFAYGNYHNEQKYKDKALQWLEETAAESNSIIKGFDQSGIENRSAYDSQSLIELKNEYCNKKRCLDCSVGNFLLKTDRQAFDP